METGLMNFDLAAMFTKWLGDWRADQAPNGDLPHTSPNAVPAGGGPAWGGFVVALPWHLYLQYGDTRVLEETYPNIRNWLAFLETNVKNGLLQPYVGIGHPRAKWSFLGDWVPPGRDQAANRVDERSTLFFNNCYMIYNLRLATKIAGVLGETEDVRQYEKRANELATEAHEQFFNVDEATYANGEQPYLAMPLLFDLVPDELESKIMDSLEDAILVKNEGHLNTGMHGTYYLLKWLTEADRNDLAYEIVSKETYPSWGFMLRNGATTIWEEWNGDNSQIHNTLISVGGWFIQGLAGIQYDEQTPGFKHFTIQPSLPDDLSHVSGQYRSIHGTIRAGWVRRVNELGMTVEVPANTSATVIIPAEHPDRVMERDQPVSRAEGVRKVDFADGRARVLVGSGSYRFTTVLPKK
jgi:alpha-L-rhamnosidase